MATKLTFAKPGFMDRDSYTNLWDARINTFIQRVEDVPLQGMQFVQKLNDTPSLGDNDQMTSKITSWSNILGLPRKSSDTDPVFYDQPAKGYTASVNIYTYRLGVRITETLVKLDRSGRINDMLSGLPDAAKKLYEYTIADLIISGTTTLGADGSYIFAQDHYRENAAEGGTWSNLMDAAALSPASYDAMRIAMRRRTGERGSITPLMLKKIICNANNQQVALQIAQSEYIPDSALRGRNPWKGVDVEVYDYLTSTTAWLGMADLPENSKGLHLQEFTPPRVSALPKVEHIQAAYELYVQFGVGASQVRNLVYNAGA